MKEYGYIKVGAFVNKLHLGNPKENAKEIIKGITEGIKKEVAILLTPELSLTGYTCGDMFLQDKLLKESLNALEEIKEATKDKDITVLVGIPLEIDNELYNCATVLENGKILGVIPKTFIPNYNEFYEARWFSSSKNLKRNKINLLGEEVPVSTNLLFRENEICFAVEICEDLWTVNPPSNSHAQAGANIIFNLSSSNEGIGKHEYRKNLVSMQSAKTISAYIYASSGPGESSSDILFGGASMIYENGSLLAENKRFTFENNLITADIDIKKLQNDRLKNKSYMANAKLEEYLTIPVFLKDSKKLERVYKEYPFVPSNILERKKRSEEILDIASTALARRLMTLNYPKCVIGMSGGLDSTLAFLIIIRALKKLNRDATDILGITMPGFGTTSRTYDNACNLVKEYGGVLKEISIKEACLVHLKDIGLDENDRSVAYENAQARERTQILMDVANKENGIVIGTGDLSELALGWCTYNGDHMSMYAVNSSIPKTLVRYLVEYVKEEETGKKKEILEDILNTPISPELLPPDKLGNMLQKTESTIGPYVLHDFFLYHFLRYGAEPKKLLYIAINTFKDTLSPRGDLRMPSDMDKTIWTELD